MKKAPRVRGLSQKAERGRFELPNGTSPLLVFETSAFNRSATSPEAPSLGNDRARSTGSPQSLRDSSAFVDDD